jgi:hypothetical protein
MDEWPAIRLGLGRSEHEANKQDEGEETMTTWTTDELNRIGSAEELQIASRRPDGTLRRPVTIWVVRLGDDLYVRSVNGRAAGWFRGTQATHEGRIWAGGMERDVAFGDAGQNTEDQIDAAYRAKYHRYAASIVGHIVSDEARSATLKLLPRSAGS